MEIFPLSVSIYIANILSAYCGDNFRVGREVTDWHELLRIPYGVKISFTLPFAETLDHCRCKSSLLDDS